MKKLFIFVAILSAAVLGFFFMEHYSNVDVQQDVYHCDTVCVSNICKCEYTDGMRRTSVEAEIIFFSDSTWVSYRRSENRATVRQDVEERWWLPTTPKYIPVQSDIDWYNVKEGDSIVRNGLSYTLLE